MRKLLSSALSVVTLTLVSNSVQAADILFIGNQVDGLSLDETDPGADRVGDYHSLLTVTLGHTVTYDTDGVMFTAAAAPTWENTYDLVIIGNSIAGNQGSGPYTAPGLKDSVDAVNVPVLAHNTFGTRNNRFNWMDESHGNDIQLDNTERGNLEPSEDSESKVNSNLDSTIVSALFSGITLENDGTDDFIDAMGPVPARVTIGAPPAGDYNNDTVVNLADYTVWRDNLGAPTGTLPNDPTDDQITPTIGQEQYTQWKDNLGQTAVGMADESFVGPYTHQPDDIIGPSDGGDPAMRPEDPDNPGTSLIGGEAIFTTNAEVLGGGQGGPGEGFDYIPAALWTPGAVLGDVVADPGPQRTTADWKMYLGARTFIGTQSEMAYLTEDGMTFLGNAITMLLNPPDLGGGSLVSSVNVPEPSSIATMMFGAVGTLLVARRRRK